MMDQILKDILAIITALSTLAGLIIVILNRINLTKNNADTAAIKSVVSGAATPQVKEQIKQDSLAEGQLTMTPKKEIPSDPTTHIM